jgi:hypothetical protein
VLLVLVPLVAPALASRAAGAATAAEMRLVSQSAWVAPAGTFEIEVQPPALPPDATVVADVYSPVSSASQLAQTAAGRRLGGSIVTSVTVPLAAITRTPTGALALAYPMVSSGPAPTDGFRIANPGVYPFRLRVLNHNGDDVAELITHLVRLAPAETSRSSSRTPPPLALALVVPVDAPVSHEPDGRQRMSDATQRALSAEIDLLRNHTSVPVSLAPTPETVDALADRDATTGGHMVDDLQAAASGHQVITGSYVAVDSGAWLAAGLAAGYTRQLATGQRTLSTTLDEAVPGTMIDTDGTTTSAVLSQLFALGGRQVVVPSNRLAPTARSSSPAANAGPLTQWFDLESSNLNRLAAVPADTTLAAQLTATPDAVRDAHEVLAQLALVSSQPGTQACVRNTSANACARGVAIELPRDAGRAATSLGVLLDALADPTSSGSTAGLPDTVAPLATHGTALLRGVTAADYLTTVDPASASGRTTTAGARQLRELQGRTPPSLGDYPRAFTATTSGIDAYTTMVAATKTPKGLDLVDSMNQVALCSGSVAFDAARRTAYLAGAAATQRGETSQITAPTQQTVTLTSAQGRIPFSIGSALDYPVDVVLHYVSPKLSFLEGETQTVRLEGGQTLTHVTIPVRTRASGAFTLQITISSPNGGLILARTRYNVRSTAVSGAGLVLTIAAGLFLAVWWARHFRKVRRGRRLVGSPHPAVRARHRDAGASDPEEVASDESPEPLV